MLLAAGRHRCLFMVVVTSVKAARRRLRYESWHLLHLYAYLGVGLALPHQLWTGQQFLSSPGRTVFWWTAWGVAAGAVLVWRVGMPAVAQPAAPAAGHLGGPRGRRRRLGPRHRPPAGPAAGRGRPVLHLALPRPAPAGPAPTPTRSRRRPTAAACGSPSRPSATAAPRRSACGPAPGSLVEGPYGRLSARARTRRKVALIGAGVGITPLRALAEGLDYAPGRRRPAAPVHRREPLFAREFDVLARERGPAGAPPARPPPRRRTPGWADGVGDRSTT